MKIGYSMPKPSAIALSGGAGAAWLTNDGGGACFDGKPARRARLQWRDDAVPAIAHTVSITLDIASTKVGVTGVLGLRNVPAGTRLEIYGKRPADADTTYDFEGQNTGVVLQFADGTFGAWFLLPDAAEAVTRVEFRIFNDAGGATWATAATTVDVGELVAMPVLHIDIDAGWAQPRMDPSQVSRSRASQVSAVPFAGYRELNCTYSQTTEAKVRYGGLPGGMDWTRLDTALMGAQRCVVVPRWKTGGAVDPAKVNAHAMYGIAAELGEIQHITGPFWRRAARFQEVPAT